MKKLFQYSVLQYKHSLTLGEAVNVGVLFFFPESEKISFIADSSNRLKSIYKNFDSLSFHQLITGITHKVSKQNSLFHSSNLKTNLKSYIHSYLLNEDSTVLQFGEIVSVIHIFETDQKAIESYVRLLLPWINSQPAHQPIKHTETYLLKKFNELISKKDKNIKDKLIVDKVIETKEISIKFDFGWQNGSLNLIKPISFDLGEAQAIQHKSVAHLGYLTLLESIAKKENIRFDFLIGKPQNENLKEAYSRAIEILNEAKSPKRIITEDNLNDYTEEAFQELINH